MAKKLLKARPHFVRFAGATLNRGSLEFTFESEKKVNQILIVFRLDL
jgi:hypothetical protein